VTISRFSGLVPWERHMHGDEYLQVLEGELDIAIIDGDESYEVGLSAGSAFIVPRAAWHKQKPKGAVTLLVVRAVEHGPVSFADDPRET
ncbi:MAG: cupin domain-containing protein, partial [Gammaproteobacteria bacterium]